MKLTLPVLVCVFCFLFVAAALRGVTARICILEEAAFINPDVVTKVITPLLSVDNSVIMGISTPDSENDQNYYNRFMDFEHPSRPGEQMFKVIKLALACDDCVDAGKASECTHRSHLLPPWKSSGTMRRVAVLMDNAKLHQQENMGMLQPSTKYLFPPHLIKKMQKLERQDWEGHKPQIVYIGIDPSGGGNSNYAMASTARDSDGRVWIVGLDHTDSIDYRVIDGMIFRHIYALRKHPLYKDCLFVVFVEANMSALDTGRVHDLIKAPELEPIDVISMDPKDKGRIGIWTTPTNKECYINLTVELMEHRALGFCKETVTVTSTADSKDIEKDLIGQVCVRMCVSVCAC